MLLLSPRDIASALQNEADQASAVGMMAYNFAGQQPPVLRHWPNLRLIIGVSPDDERSVMAMRKLQWFSNMSQRAALRILPKSHTKLAVFRTSARRGYARAIISTMNGPVERDFKEIGIIVTGSDARQLWSYFESCWAEAIPVNPLDVKDLARVLASSVFEAPAGRL